LVLMVGRWLFILRRRSPVSPTYCFEQALQLMRYTQLSAWRHITQYFVVVTRNRACKFVIVSAVLTQMASDIGISFKATIHWLLVNGLSSFTLTKSFKKFQGRPNAAIEGSWRDLPFFHCCEE
jgi:hypothetical protein